MTTEVLPDVLPRIKALAAATSDAYDAAKLLQRQRDELIAEAVDAGISQRAVAEHASMARSRVVAILSNTELVHYE